VSEPSPHLLAVLTLLEQAGIGVQGESLFAGTQSDLPDTGTYLTVTQTGGFSPVGIHNSTSLRRPSFQIMGQGDSSQDVSTMLEAAFNVTMLANKQVGGVFFLFMWPEQDPFSLSSDPAERVRMAFNVETLTR
jgi:hypothetical protein